MNYTLLYLLFCQIALTCSRRKPVSYKPKLEQSHFSNPNFIKDQIKVFSESLYRPPLPKYNTSKFHPAWMDYCDPYHCNDYHKLACGLNRKSMRFKWFQSACHLILNNKCATYRGALRYDLVETKFCYQYVMYYRAGCAKVCADDALDPVCGVSLNDNHLVVFKNECALNAANCNSVSLQEYEEIDSRICTIMLL